MKLTIDPQFSKLCRPLTDEEEAMLSESIKADGCREPLVIWDHKNTILDGYNRHRLCTKHGKSFKTVKRSFETRDEAIAWILRNQLGRRNLDASQRAMLAAKMPTIGRGKLAENDVEGAKLPDLESVAGQFDVSPRSVKSARKVVEDGSSALNAAVEAGDIPVSVAAKVADLPKAEQNKLIAKGPEAVREAAAEDRELEAEPIKELTFEEQVKRENGKIESFCRGLTKWFEENCPNVASIDHMGRFDSALGQVRAACGTLRTCKYHDEPCPKCSGNGCSKCEKESDFGAVTVLTYRQLAG